MKTIRVIALMRRFVLNCKAEKENRQIGERRSTTSTRFGYGEHSHIKVTKYLKTSYASMLRPMMEASHVLQRSNTRRPPNMLTCCPSLHQKHGSRSSRAHLARGSGLNYNQDQRAILGAEAKTIGKESHKGVFQVLTIPSQPSRKTTNGKSASRSYRGKQTLSSRWSRLCRSYEISSIKE